MQSPAISLAQEQAALLRLVDKLRQEQTLLADVSVEGMTELIIEKASIVAEMTTLAGHRHERLAAAGFPAEEAGMQQWIDAHGADTDKQIWASLFEYAQQAKELNRLNGMLIGKKLSQNQSALTILQGKNNAGSFYGPDGQSSIKSSGRRLGIV